VGHPPIALDPDVQITVQMEESPGSNVLAQEIENIQNGVPNWSSPFAQEMDWISQTPSLWDRITWYMGALADQSNPFE
jgi:hypothetical protein